MKFHWISLKFFSLLYWWNFTDPQWDFTNTVRFNSLLLAFEEERNSCKSHDTKQSHFLSPFSRAFVYLRCTCWPCKQDVIRRSTHAGAHKRARANRHFWHALLPIIKSSDTASFFGSFRRYSRIHSLYESVTSIQISREFFFYLEYWQYSWESRRTEKEQEVSL